MQGLLEQIQKTKIKTTHKTQTRLKTQKTNKHIYATKHTKTQKQTHAHNTHIQVPGRMR